MTLNELIEKLHHMQLRGHGTRQVLLADWNEEYATPYRLQKSEIKIMKVRGHSSKAIVLGAKP